MVALGCVLAAATFLSGDSGLYEQVNSIAVVGASGFFLIRFIARGSAKNRGPEATDFVVLRWGLLIFLAFVAAQNLVELFAPSWPLLEPFGFAAFLSTLGYVATSSTLRRDQQLKEIRNELKVARRIQFSILPDEFPTSTNFRGAARYVPMGW
jgi:sigma-B regulation protein RsbU (phosphoserine phosphatase)